MQVAKRHGTIDLKKGWFKAVLIVLLWLLIVSLIRDYGRINKGFERKKMAEMRLVEERARNESLKQELNTVSSLEYKERLIREKLNMQKNGEVVVVMPEWVAQGTMTEDVGDKAMGPNWEKWLKVVVY